ncbi:uncharacterized protein [Parasteatoda tepidariorum]|uniref:uncharacterized protein n=1 Tax=Parasteatoda tepidariorum TaxID=114398 RepID=UPI00077FCC93|nr:protein ANTAGONIST OF LIKE HETEROCHROMATIN PROTEIN 1-like [Parasteatoda tepidariorum]
MSDEIIALSATIMAVAAASAMKKKEKKRSKWSREWLLRRNKMGAYHSLMAELKLEDPGAFRNFVRMDEESFLILLEKVSPMISKQNTVMRDSIPAAERLAVTLRYLASGDSYSSLMFLFRIDKSTLSNFIPETCEAIYAALQDYIQVPSTEEEWIAIAKEFEEKWNFPNCFGSLDGKHVLVRHKRKYGSQLFNYKLSNSIVLFALVDANCNFLYVDVGTNGRVADSTIFSKSTLFSALENRALSVPGPTRLVNQLNDSETPFVMVADEAFPLKSYLMKPYPKRNLTRTKRIFNYRLSRARRTVENAFGILSARFEVLQRVNPLDIKKVESIVLACCALHNYLRKTSSASRYSPPNFFNRENTQEGAINQAPWSDHSYAGIRGVARQSSSFSSLNAREVRDELCSYFNGVGKVPWQDRFIV